MSASNIRPLEAGFLSAFPGTSVEKRRSSPRSAAGPEVPRERRSPLCDSAVCLRFAQDRLALVGKVLFAFGFAYLGVALVKVLAGVEPLWASGRESHLLATAIA